MCLGIQVTSFYVFLSIENKRAVDFLFTEGQQAIYINLTVDNSAEIQNELISQLNQFSIEHQINIAQYVMFWNFNVTIYMTEISNNEGITLTQGTYPSGDQHISNINYSTSNTYQVGQFIFPTSPWYIRIYDMEQVKNIGFLETFHLIGASDEIINHFINEFSTFGDVSLVVDDWLFNNIQLFQNDLNWIRDSEGSFFSTISPLVFMISFSFLSLMFSTFVYTVKHQKQSMVQELWGFSPATIYLNMLQEFLFFIVLVISIICSLFLLILRRNHANNFLLEYLFSELSDEIFRINDFCHFFSYFTSNC